MPTLSVKLTPASKQKPDNMFLIGNAVIEKSSGYVILITGFVEERKVKSPPGAMSFEGLCFNGSSEIWRVKKLMYDHLFEPYLGDITFSYR